MDYSKFKTRQEWNQYLLDELRGRDFKDDLEGWKSENGSFRFVHFSPHIDELISDGSLRISGGGLMGAVYVTPVHTNRLVHNLGQYIFDTEIPQSLQQQNTKCIVFEISEDEYLKSLRTGKFNYIFESKYFITTAADPAVQKIFHESIDEIKQLLSVEGGELFLEKSNNFFNRYPALKHIYFETFNEYLYIRQDSEEVAKYASMGEVYAKAVKDFLFSICPKLKTSFSTAHFETDTFVHLKNLEQDISPIKHFYKDDFLNFICNRLRFYFTELCDDPRAVEGRLSLKLTSIADRGVIEQHGANALRDALSNTTVYQYDTIPKGELGITPLTRGLIYSAVYKDGYVELGDSIDIKISSELVGHKQSVLRVKN